MGLNHDDTLASIVIGVGALYLVLSVLLARHEYKHPSRELTLTHPGGKINAPCAHCTSGEVDAFVHALTRSKEQRLALFHAS